MPILDRISYLFDFSRLRTFRRYTHLFTVSHAFSFFFFLFISLPSFQLAFRPRISRATTITERFIRPNHFHYHRLISSTVQFPLYLFLSSVYDRCGRYLLSYRAVPNCTSCVNCRGAYREGANQRSNSVDRPVFPDPC